MPPCFRGSWTVQKEERIMAVASAEWSAGLETKLTGLDTEHECHTPVGKAALKSEKRQSSLQMFGEGMSERELFNGKSSSELDNPAEQEDVDSMVWMGTRTLPWGRWLTANSLTWQGQEVVQIQPNTTEQQEYGGETAATELCWGAGGHEPRQADHSDLEHHELNRLDADKGNRRHPRDCHSLVRRRGSAREKGLHHSYMLRRAAQTLPHTGLMVLFLHVSEGGSRPHTEQTKQ